MKKFGCAAAVIGAILCIAGLALYVTAGIGTMQARRVASIPLPVGRATRSELVTVDPTRLCSISVSADVRSKYPGFSFPLRYSVVDESGQILSSGQTVFAKSSAVWTSRTMTGRSGGWYRHEYGYEPFAVKPPGRVRVEVQLDPETEVRRGTVEEITLTLYDNVRDHRGPVIAGSALLVGGVVAGVLGIVLFIAGAARARQTVTGG